MAAGLPPPLPPELSSFDSILLKNCGRRGVSVVQPRYRASLALLTFFMMIERVFGTVGKRRSIGKVWTELPVKTPLVEVRLDPVSTPCHSFLTS